MGRYLLERQVLDAPLDGIVLRHGLLPRPGHRLHRAHCSGFGPCRRRCEGRRACSHKGQRGLYNVTETDRTTSSDKAIQLLGWDAGWRCNE